MRGLRAALFKDLRLFASGAGLIAAVLPLLLLLALRAGLGDLSAQAYVQPFPIAVRDLDGTIMSRSLTSQMERLELFSRLILLEEDEPDAAALEQGAAAVITIPKDFFYDLYTMEDCPVDVTLNGNMELESTLLRGIFASVMDIIRADQTSWQGTYTFCYGELTGEQRADLYARSSQALITDALGRQTVFSAQIQNADLQGALERRLLASVLAAAALFFALAAVKSLPEELELGVMPRFRAAGGSLPAFVLSKLLLAILALLPALALLLLVLRPEGAVSLLLLSLVLLFGSFGILLCLAAWSGSSAAAQRRGNLFLLLSLALGGTLWPRQLLPAPLSALGGWTVPGFALLGVEASAQGLEPSELLSLMYPLMIVGLLGCLLALPALLRRRSGGPDRDRLVRTGEPGPDAPRLTALPLRLLSMSGRKQKGMSGGLIGLAVLIAAGVLCGLTAGAARTGSAASLSLAVCDLDGSDLSQELAELLAGCDGLTLTQCDPEEGEKILLSGTAEGLLTIHTGYGEELEAGERPALDYRAAAASVATQGAREIVAGQYIVQSSRLQARVLAEELLQRPLTREETDGLAEEIRRTGQDAPAPYRIHTQEGTSPAEPFLPDAMGFAALAVLLIALTAASWSGPDGRLVEDRLRALPGGRLLAYGSEWAALTGLGTLTALAVLLAAGELDLFGGLAAAAYALCAGALALALIRLTALQGRVDVLAPFLALFLCLAGGCFMDLSQLSPELRRLALVTPPGLAVEAAQESWKALLALTGEGCVLALLGAPRRWRA